ncbi:MAG: cell division protein FtsZ [Candidatus Aminicenantes bacterium RBG_13_62_12]|nr:MAG: cell division protein FtsZ [Candidatus Aminicenantes bacterium RBG_13_62_12]
MKDDPGNRIKFQPADEPCYGANIKVLGIGGGGNNALNRMIEMGIEGVEFIAVNTDLQTLNLNKSSSRLQVGTKLTRGRGSGGRPEVGKQAALEDQELIANTLYGADMVFLTAGLGGGTGTGATPVIARLAADMDMLVIAVVTLPFTWEGRVRARQAQEGLQELRTVVDTVIATPNDRLLQTCDASTTFQDALKLADDVLRQGVQGISDIITRPGLINRDFEDVRSIMKNMGMAFMGMGQASGENRVVEAAQKAISSPLLADTSIEGAQGMLINITGGRDLTLHEVNKASELIHRLAHEEANIIFGAVIDETMKDMAKVTVIATGFSGRPAAEKIVPLEPPPPAVFRKKTPPPVPVFRETSSVPSDMKLQAPTQAHEQVDYEKNWDHYEKATFLRNQQHSRKRFPSDYEPS